MTTNTPRIPESRCPLCRRMVPTCCTEDDRRPRFIDHNCTSGPRAGRECDNSGELVNPKEQSQ